MVLLIFWFEQFVIELMNMRHWILFCLAGIDLLMVFYCRVPLIQQQIGEKNEDRLHVFTAYLSLSQQVDGVLGERRPVSVLSVSPWDWGLESLKIPGFRDTDSNTPTQSFVEFIPKKYTVLSVFYCAKVTKPHCWHGQLYSHSMHFCC